MCSDRTTWPTGLLLAVVWGGCAVRLDSVPEASDSPAALPDLTGCTLLQGSEISGVLGRARLTRLPDEPDLVWLVDGVLLPDESSLGPSILRHAGDGDACSGSGSVAVSPLFSSEEADTWLSPMQVIETEGDAGHMYYAANQGWGAIRGYGIATYDSTLGAYAPSAILWTGDRPAFGVAAMEQDGFALVWGCRNARFLDADCWLGRVPSGQLADASQYEYARGGGNWTTRIDDAWPLLAAGTSVSVMPLQEHERLLMAYVPPLSRDIVFRTGLAPDGPWSAPVAAARCTTAQPESFCSDVTLVRETGGGVELTYAVSTLEGGAFESNPMAFRTRFAWVKLPDSLP